MNLLKQTLELGLRAAIICMSTNIIKDTSKYYKVDSQAANSAFMWGISLGIIFSLDYKSRKNLERHCMLTFNFAVAVILIHQNIPSVNGSVNALADNNQNINYAILTAGVVVIVRALIQNCIVPIYASMFLDNPRVRDVAAGLEAQR